MHTDAAAATTLGVIDIGSNSGRVIAACVSGASHIEVIADAASPLRLVRDVARSGRLRSETIERTIEIVRGFKAVAMGAGAERTTAVATAAVREASNGEALIERARSELSIPVEIADGEQEASFGFLGAVHGLPIEHGIVLDVGGGSLQLVHFRDRRLQRSWSLPLGALRLSDRFLKSDPPSRGEMRNLKEHVYERLQKVGVESLGSDEHLVGTGGTIRNLGKLDRRAQADYPISRLHGYVLERRRVDDVTSLLSSAPAGARGRLPGLNADRADSIVGGALVVQSIMDRLLAPDLTVAGYGLREGIALRSRTEAPAAIADVRRAALDALAAHFTSYNAALAQRRETIAAQLLERLDPQVSFELRDATRCAARLLDIGRSVDYYRRHAHAARIVADANLDGCSHRLLALVAAVLLAAGEREASTKAFAPLLGPNDQLVVERAAATVVLTEALVRYGSSDFDPTWPERRNGHVALAVPVLDNWPLEAPMRRAERAFGLTFSLRTTAHAA
jgi:exopolyphosphatase / guanosine-5'-triphosphate,3'-diphosphate pyrophosphatase